MTGKHLEGIERTHEDRLSPAVQKCPFLYLNSLPWLRPVSHNWLDENLFDSEDILKLMVKELKAKAVIPRNPRNKQKGEFYFKQRRLYCPADIPMMKKEK